MLERVSETLRPAVPRARGVRTMLAVALLTVASFAAAVELRGDHPDTYVVKRGDTLWDIAGRFLQRPWLWPEIWQANPQVKNPHLIYPGDVLSLAYLDRVAMQPGQRSESPVNAVNLSEIEPFLKDLRIVDSIEGLPYVVGLEDDRLRSSRGQVAYIKGLDGIAPGQRYLVVRPEKRYRFVERAGLCCDLFQSEDLDARGDTFRGTGEFWTNAVFPSKNTEMLGYELITQSTGTVTRGEVAGIQASTLLLDAEGRDVRVGDRLIPVEAQPYDLQFFPHPPKEQQKYGRLTVMSVADKYRTGGPHDVIAISGGSPRGHRQRHRVLDLAARQFHRRHHQGRPGQGRNPDPVRVQGAPAGRVRRPCDGVPHLQQRQLRAGDEQRQADHDRLRAEASGRAVLIAA
jgi:hypothetical protein